MRRLCNIFATVCITVCLLIIPTTCISRPTGLRAFVVSENTFRIKWVENFRNAKKNTIYTLRYRLLGGEDDFRYINTTKSEIKKLVVTSNGSYEFSIKAIRGRKESEWSEPVLKSLDSEIRVGPPRGLKVKDVSATDIKIKWRRPKSKRHTISGYRITWKVIGTKITTLKHTQERTIQLNNLKPGTPYIIRVQTISDKGFPSQPAKTTVRTLREITIPPPSNFTVDVFGSTKLLVKWTAPRDHDLSKVTGFQIQYRQKGIQKGTLCTVVTTKKKQKYIITDLYKGQQYKVRIAIKSGQLTGRYTDWVTVTLTGGKPKKERIDNNAGDGDDDVLPENLDPTTDNDEKDTAIVQSSEILSVLVNKTDYSFEGQNVTLTCAVRYHGNSDISTTWTKGSDLRFDRIGAWFIEITGRHHLVEATQRDGNETIFVSKLTLLKLRTKDSGGYTCHVLNSDQSAEVLLKVTDASPGPPEDIEAEALSHSSIGAYWSPPKNSAGFPITYELHCWRERHLLEYGYKHTIIKDITETEYIISSLEYDTKYHIGVVAVNQFGRSNFSHVGNVTIKTFDLPPLDISDIRIYNPLEDQNTWDQNEIGVTPGDFPDNNGDTETKTSVVVTIAWDKIVTHPWPMIWTQHIIHYKTDDNNTVHQKSVWENSTVIDNLEDDKLYYFRVETVFPDKSVHSPWRKFSTYLKERTVPPPPRDMFLNILTNGSLVIKWLPPPEEYRVRVRHYQLQVAEDDGKTLFFRFNKDITSHVIKVIDQSKTYTVEVSAVNNVGLSDSIVRMIDHFGTSSDTVHLIARPVSSKRLRVSWTVAPNSNLTRFLLRHRATNANISQPKDLFLKPTTTHYVIDNLQEHTEYSISLIPYINDVPGNLTSKLVWTLSDVPSAPPKAVTIQNINITNFMVSWEPPPEYAQNGKLIFYRVEYRTKFDMTSKNMLVPAGKNELLLTGLEAGIVYGMRVAAVTVNGTGPFSSWVQMVVTKSGNVIEEPPEAPTNLTVESISEGITLSWSPPDNTSIPVKGYIVGHGRFIPEVYRKILGPADTEYSISGLRPNARYILTVRSFNSYGESKPTLIKAKSGKKQSILTTIPEITTPTTTPVPGAPYDIKIREQGLEVPTALVTWKRPAISDHIKGYILLYTNNSSLPLYEWTGVFERSLQYVIKNLSFNTTYYIRIQTQLADGSAVMSPTKFFTTRAADKSKDNLPKPKFMSAFSGPDNIQISWQPPEYAYIIRGYVLGYGVEQPGEYQEMLPFSETSFTIKRLAPETKYHISLRSFGEFGESEKAVISVSTTG